MGKTKHDSWVPGSGRLTYQAFVERNPGKEEPTMKSVSVVSRSQRGCETQRGDGRELRAAGRWDVVGK